MARGSMRQREPGVWDIQVSAGKDPVTGKRRRLTRRVHGSEREAERGLTALQHEADTGKHGGTLASVATVVERWWEIHGPYFSPTTAQRYRQIIDQYLVPRWGDVRISELDVSEVSAWFQALHRTGKPGRNGKPRPLKPASVRQIRAVFRRAMKEAVNWGWIPTNPIDRTTGVPVPKARKEADDPETVRRLFTAAGERDPRLAVWVLVAATTGMRRSEMAGLQWKDVDLDVGLVEVHRAIVQVGKALHTKGTKTSQNRKLRLDTDTIRVLRAHRAQAEREAEAAMTELDADALVWSSSPDGGEPVSPDGMSQAWRRLCRAQGVAGVRLHDLRHFMATQAILAGLNVAMVSKRLGHANISTTLNIYTDHLEAADQDVADHLGSIFRVDPGVVQNEMQLLEWQGHRCGACAVPFGGGHRRVLDHVHQTGLVRGWLCMGCNIAEGCDNEPSELDPEVRARWTWDWYRGNPPAQRAGLVAAHAPPVAAPERDEARDRDAADTMGRLLTAGRNRHPTEPPPNATKRPAQ